MWVVAFGPDSGFFITQPDEGSSNDGHTRVPSAPPNAWRCRVLFEGLTSYRTVRAVTVAAGEQSGGSILGSQRRPGPAGEHRCIIGKRDERLGAYVWL